MEDGYIVCIFHSLTCKLKEPSLLPAIALQLVLFVLSHSGRLMKGMLHIYIHLHAQSIIYFIKYLLAEYFLLTASILSAEECVVF